MNGIPCAEPQHSMPAGEVQESHVVHAAGSSTQQAVPPQHNPAGLASLSLLGGFADGVSGSSMYTTSTALAASQRHANRACRTSRDNHSLSLLLEAYMAATTPHTGTADNAAAAAAVNPSPVACPQTVGSKTAACDPVPAAGPAAPSPAVAQLSSQTPSPTAAPSKPTASSSTTGSSSSSLSRLGCSKYGHFLQQEVSLTLSQGPSRPGRQKCEPFLDWGYCRYGSGCIFDHPRNHGVFLTPSGLPFRPAEPICPTYLDTNTCKFGPACRKHHPSREARQPVLAAKGTASGAGTSNKTLKDSVYLPPADAASVVATVQAKSPETDKDSRPAAAGHNLPSSAGQPAAAPAAGKRKLLKAARSHNGVKTSSHSTAGQENVQVPFEDADVSSAVSGNSGNNKAPQLQLPTAPDPQMFCGKATGDGCNTGTNSSSTKPLLQQQPGEPPAQAPPAHPVGNDATAQGRQHVLTFSSPATAVTVPNHNQQQQHGRLIMQPPGARLFQRATAAVQPDAAARGGARAPLSNIQPSGAKPPRPRPARAAVKPASKQMVAPKPSAAALDTKHTPDADHKATVAAAAQGTDTSHPHTRSQAHCNAAQQADGRGGDKQRALTAAGVVPAAAAAAAAVKATGRSSAAGTAEAPICPSKQQSDAIDWHLLGPGRQTDKVESGAAAAGAVSNLGSSSLFDMFLPMTSRPIRPLRTCLDMFASMAGSITAEATAAAAAQSLPHGFAHARKMASAGGTNTSGSEQLWCLDGCTGSIPDIEPKPAEHRSCKPDTYSEAATAAAAGGATATGATAAAAAASGTQAVQQAAECALAGNYHAGAGCMQQPSNKRASAAPNAAFTTGSGSHQAAPSAGLTLHQDRVRTSSGAACKFTSTGLAELAEAKAQEQLAARALGAALTAVAHAEAEGGSDKAQGWRDLAASLAALKQAAANSASVLAKCSSCSAQEAAKPSAAQIGKAELRGTAAATTAAGAVAGLGPSSLLDSLLATPSRPTKPLLTCRDMFSSTPSSTAQATAAAVAAAAAAAQPLPQGLNHAHKMVSGAGIAGDTPASQELRGLDGCIGVDPDTRSSFNRGSSSGKPDTSRSTAATATTSALLMCLGGTQAAHQAASSAPSESGDGDVGGLQQPGMWMAPAAPGSGPEAAANTGSGANRAPLSPGQNVRKNIRKCRKAAGKAARTGLTAVAEAQATATRLMASALSAAADAEAAGQADAAEQYRGLAASAAALKHDAAASVQAAHAAELSAMRDGFNLDQFEVCMQR